jgi:hypothetical protein
MAYQMPTSEMIKCIKDCGDCAEICAQCAHHCLHMGGEHASPQHQGIMRDCHEICAMAVSYMARASRHSPDLCRVCAAVCVECAESCERMADGDRMMTDCAKICRRCAQSCEQMAGVSV